tara:strand:- start:2203 stop:3312 length:1110 start_codon:yes stop_codon:yes gene_type:complete
MKYPLIAFSAIFFISCSQDNSYTINGSIDIADDTNVYILQADQNNQPFISDSTSVKENQFLFKGMSATPKISYIQVEGVSGYVLSILENGDIYAEIYPDSISKSKVTGTKSNDGFIKYRNETKDLVTSMNEISFEAQTAIMEGDVESAYRLEKDYYNKEQEVMLYEWDFITENLDSYMSALLLEVFMIENKVNKDSIIDVYESFTNRIKVSDVGQNIAELLTEFENPIEIGQIAPDFSGPSVDGTQITFSNILGEVTLLDFWAAWCRPCRIENPNLVRIHKKYSDQGLQIVGISLDRTKDQWLQAIEDDNLPWIHISNLDFWNDPIARMYSIRAIPQSFLVDKDGVVIGKNLKGNDLEERIKFALSLND